MSLVKHHSSRLKIVEEEYSKLKQKVCVGLEFGARQDDTSGASPLQTRGLSSLLSLSPSRPHVVIRRSVLVCSPPSLRAHAPVLTDPCPLSPFCGPTLAVRLLTPPSPPTLPPLSACHVQYIGTFNEHADQQQTVQELRRALQQQVCCLPAGFASNSTGSVTRVPCFRCPTIVAAVAAIVVRIRGLFGARTYKRMEVVHALGSTQNTDPAILEFSGIHCTTHPPHPRAVTCFPAPSACPGSHGPHHACATYLGARFPPTPPAPPWRLNSTPVRPLRQEPMAVARQQRNNSSGRLKSERLRRTA